MGCGGGDDDDNDGVKNTARLCFKYKIRNKKSMADVLSSWRENHPCFDTRKMFISISSRQCLFFALTFSYKTKWKRTTLLLYPYF